jgi:hypothetical protein
MLNLGHSHPDFTYANDLAQAKLTLVLDTFASIICCALIVWGVLAM